ncbi:MAG: hypothetical protein Q7U92_15305 [Bradyrhizobium sp.]|nr:hypothetical protein [Bradyrhizobium sp.]
MPQANWIASSHPPSPEDGLSADAPRNDDLWLSRQKNSAGETSGRIAVINMHPPHAFMLAFTASAVIGNARTLAPLTLAYGLTPTGPMPTLAC